ncbi:MAG: flagellar basal body L-ring protein FlgH [Nitrospirae bacterium]|nr:MAG: flagellar basal body L-ring protein FlgH [Nitrospirota bacterium]
MFYIILAIAMLSWGCATTSTAYLPEPSPVYIEKSTKGRYEDKALSEGSLYTERASLFEDRRARRLNDLVTVLIMESVSGSKKAETSTSRDSSMDATVERFFGVPLNLNLDNLYGKGNTFSPSVSGSSQSQFDGSGETKREGSVRGTITARVVDVLPNGNLVIESRKEITVNFEKQVLVLQGIIRPEDISPQNTIESTKIADAKIFLVGEGVVDVNQKPGWLSIFLQKIWPF